MSIPTALRCYFVWKRSAMPSDPNVLADYCINNRIHVLVFKFLDGRYPYNDNDGGLPAYLEVLRSRGILIEGWGYHYPSDLEGQAIAIKNIIVKYDLYAYHLNMEREWKVEGSSALAQGFVTQLKKHKAPGCAYYLCSYRYPNSHTQFPFAVMMGFCSMATPQVYWALAHNPVQQIEETVRQYGSLGVDVAKIMPVGSTFGANFKSGGDWIYWEPTIAEIEAFRDKCDDLPMLGIYYWSLDWVLAHNRHDMVRAATGADDVIVIPPPEHEYYEVTNCTWLNARDEPSGDRLLVLKAGTIGKSLGVSGNWRKIEITYPLQVWVHDDYLEPAPELF